MLRFTSDIEVREVVQRFEACAYELAEFNHARHLTVGMAYLIDEGFEAARVRMKASLERFSGHHGKMGYHETITRFWLLQLEQVRRAQARSHPTEALWESCNAAISAVGNKDLIFEYYDRERLMSEEARQSWVEPTVYLKPDNCDRVGPGM